MATAIVKADSPANTGQAHDRQTEAVKICRDVHAGTLTIRANAKTYLPQFPKETDPAYLARKGQSVLFNAFRRTVGGLVGMVFRTDPQPTDEVPEVMVNHLDDIDLQGNHVAVFARDAFNDGMIDGHTFILVDYPTIEEGEALTLADEREQGLRPYWVSIQKQDVLSFRTRQEQGRTVLTQVAIRFRTTEEDGDFNEKEVERIRVYMVQDALGEGGTDERYVTWQLWKKKEGDTAKAKGDEYEIEAEGRLTVAEIPLVPIYVNIAAYFESDPPLLDLALENIKHYQVRSDQDNALHVASIPIPVFTGLDDDETVTVGANTGIILPIGGEAKYLEAQGSSLKHGREQILDIEQRMAALGLAMLQRQTRSAETAQAKQIDKAESDSALSSAARGLEDGLNECLRLHAAWLKTEDGGKINVNNDFTVMQMDAQMVTVLSNLVGKNQLSLDTMWQLLIEGEILPATFDPEAEYEALEEASASELAALGNFMKKAEEKEGDTGGKTDQKGTEENVAD